MQKFDKICNCIHTIIRKTGKFAVFCNIKMKKKFGSQRVLSREQVEISVETIPQMVTLLRFWRCRAGAAETRTGAAKTGKMASISKNTTHGITSRRCNRQPQENRAARKETEQDYHVTMRTERVFQKRFHIKYKSGETHAGVPRAKRARERRKRNFHVTFWSAADKNCAPWLFLGKNSLKKSLKKPRKVTGK